MNDLQLFMYLYMYELELWLNNHSDEVLNISYQSDEANTDRPLKEFLQRVIENECNSISELKATQYLDLFNYNNQKNSFRITPNIINAVIEHVYLPDEISPELKQQLKFRKNAIFTNSDLCVAIKINNIIEYETIELKSTKTDAIPGSSVQQISPDEWVIFVKHGKRNAEIAVGQYFHAINSKMQFPDRSPRPQVSFKELQNWNYSCRQYRNSIITYYSSDDESIKHELLTDWQSVLAKRWTKIVLNIEPKHHEPWFNNSLRKFILEFLGEYEKMSPHQKAEYKTFLENFIE